LDSNALFHLLPPTHRDRFLAALRNPESGEARELIEAATTDNQDDAQERIPNVLPWWEAPDILDDEEEKFADSPEAVEDELMEGIKPPPGTGSKLAYNAIAIS